MHCSLEYIYSFSYSKGAFFLDLLRHKDLTEGATGGLEPGNNLQYNHAAEEK